MSKKYLTPSQVGRILRVDVTTVRRWIKDGALDAEISDGTRRCYHIKREDVDKLLDTSSQNENEQEREQT